MGVTIEEYLRAAACSKRMRRTFQVKCEIKFSKHSRTISNTVVKFRMTDFVMDDHQHGGRLFTSRCQGNIANVPSFGSWYDVSRAILSSSFTCNTLLTHLKRLSPICCNCGLRYNSSYKLSFKFPTKTQFRKSYANTTANSKATAVVKKVQTPKQTPITPNKPPPPTQQLYEFHQQSNNIPTTVSIISKINLNCKSSLFMKSLSNATLLLHKLLDVKIPYLI